MDKVNDFSNDSDIIGWLNDHNASSEYIDYCLKFRDSSSVAGWIRNWEAGFADFGGHFGTALFNGDMEKAVGYADMENTANLKTMGYETFVVNSPYKSHEALAKASESADSVARDLWQSISESGGLSDYIHGGIFRFDITMPDWATDPEMDVSSLSWDDLNPTDKQNVIDHFGGEDGMRAELCERGWEDYCDDDAYESKAKEFGQTWSEELEEWVNYSFEPTEKYDLEYLKKEGRAYGITDSDNAWQDFWDHWGEMDEIGKSLTGESKATEVTAEDIVNKLNSNLSSDYYPRETGHIKNIEDLGNGNVRFGYSGGVIDDEIKNMFESSGFTISNVTNIMDAGHLDAEGKLGESKASESLEVEAQQWWDSLNSSQRLDHGNMFDTDYEDIDVDNNYNEHNYSGKDYIRGLYTSKFLGNQGIDDDTILSATYDDQPKTLMDTPNVWEPKSDEEYDPVQDEIEDMFRTSSSNYTQKGIRKAMRDEDFDSLDEAKAKEEIIPDWNHDADDIDLDEEPHDDSDDMYELMRDQRHDEEEERERKSTEESKATEDDGIFMDPVEGKKWNDAHLWKIRNDLIKDEVFDFYKGHSEGDWVDGYHWQEDGESMRDESALWYDTIPQGKRNKAVGQYEDVDTNLGYDFQLEDGRDLIDAHYTDSFLAKQLDIDKRNARLNYTDNAYGSMFD